ARPFAAEADALAEAQEDEAQGSQNDPARGRGGRQQADEEGAAAHDEQRGDEGLLPADPVAEVAEDDRAEGAGDEGDAEIANELSSCVVDVWLGKKSAGKTSDEA